MVTRVRIFIKSSTEADGIQTDVELASNQESSDQKDSTESSTEKTEALVSTMPIKPGAREAPAATIKKSTSKKPEVKVKAKVTETPKPAKKPITKPLPTTRPVEESIVAEESKKSNKPETSENKDSTFQ